VLRIERFVLGVAAPNRVVRAVVLGTEMTGSPSLCGACFESGPPECAPVEVIRSTTKRAPEGALFGEYEQDS